ncbi:hypothetical protein KBK19_02065 [Microvirga sp. STR05]|uniref:Uncharacterized protein n=1 Tax=Hymenobacter duratus TaxID=2771356 RepID=A0ABR8JDQ0_9BACT|nr:hypothetical protein [Hymenobacter duratus]MBD2713816.1 hypothetical protein [Hymenobacter duratus]MBR7948718.1 hypothetical protein [Microvirga sp. STR05]
MNALRIYGHLAGLLLLALTACHVNSSRLNDEQDKVVADEFMVDYFSNQQLGHTETNLRLFSSRFWQVTPRDKVTLLFRKRDELLGRLQDTALKDWTTKVISGTDPSGEYQLRYENQYANGTAIETFTLAREANDSLRILSYNISSDAFFR